MDGKLIRFYFLNLCNIRVNGDIVINKLYFVYLSLSIHPEIYYLLTNLLSAHYASTCTSTYLYSYYPSTISSYFFIRL